MKISESFARKLMIASLSVAFVMIAVHSAVNHRYYYSVVHCQKPFGDRTAGISVITRVARQNDASAAQVDRLKELSGWGWRINEAEITRSEEFNENFRAAFRDRPTEAPYLSYNDARGREVRVYFFERNIERPLLEEHRALLERAKARDLKIVGYPESA